MTQESDEIPRLEPPGAGLPAVQEWTLKHAAFPLLKHLVSWERAMAAVEKEGATILRRVRALPAEERRRRVLVPRLMGIEDSSRYWSLDMVLDHLVIVTDAVADGIVRLGRGETIPKKVDTAEVKPRSDAGAEVEAAYEQLMGDLRGRLERDVVDRHTANCHIHPWFGCLNPHQWLVMLAIHQYIHRRQVMAIIRRL